VEYTVEGLVAIGGNILFNTLWINPTAIPQHNGQLVAEEGVVRIAALDSAWSTI
jgi:hypothetical protein